MRELCFRCRWPKEHCWCRYLSPMKSRTKLVILMHPHEERKVKAGTGRFTALSFEDAEIIVGISFSENPRLRALLQNPAYKAMLLYPGSNAKDLSNGGLRLSDLEGKRLLVILLDATWFLAKKMLKLNPELQALPRLMFSPNEKSRWIIKQQPAELCLSTLEAVHELMLALEKAGLDRYEKPDQLLSVFRAMQDFQIECAADPSKRSYRNGAVAYQKVRTPTRQSPKAQRRLFFHDKPVQTAEPAGQENPGRIADAPILETSSDFSGSGQSG